MKYILQNKITFDTKKNIFYFVSIIIFFLSIYPVSILIAYSFGISVNNIDLSLDTYIELFKKREVYKVTINTIYMAIGITIFSGLIGIVIAFLVEKTNIFFKKTINTLVFTTLIIPSYIMAIAWIEFIGNNGYLKRSLLKGLDFNIYSLEGVIFVMTLHLYPIVFMGMASVFKKFDYNLEKSAFLCGASNFNVLKTIIFPHIKINFLYLLLFVFSKSIACFGVASILALPARKYILTTYIYSAMSAVDFKSATAISVVLLCFSLIMFLITNRLLSKRETLYSKQINKVHVYDLGKYRLLTSVSIVLFLLITSFLPIVIILISSFLKRWGIQITLNNLTLNNYFNIFNNEMFLRAIKNSFLYGVLTSFVSIFLSIIVCYCSNRTKIKGKKIVEVFALFPMAIPETIIATAAVFAWISKPVKLYATPWIIILTYVAVCMPFFVNNINGLMSSYSPTLENASYISGANFVQTIKNIIIPIIKPGIITGTILTMLFALKEIPISIMLYSSGCETVGVLMFNLRSDVGGLETISAIAIIVIILMFVGQLILKNIGKIKKEVE